MIQPGGEIMALPIDINALVSGRRVESSRIEYKASWNPESCIHTLCAFANDLENQDGGYIILGVEEKDGRPVLPPKGVDPNGIDALQKEILQYCHFIDPFYSPRIEICECEGRTLLVLWAMAGTSRPYSASRNVFSNQQNKAYYVRIGSSTVVAESELLKQLYDNSSRLSFDDRINPHADVSDLNASLMIEHLKAVESDLYQLASAMTLEDIAENMNLLGGPEEMRMPKNVGLLMFSRKTQKYFPEAVIEVVNKPDPTGENMVERTFRGTLQDQLQDALEYISNSILCEKITKPEGSLTSKRCWNYPYRAVKEILANAVYHRDYQINEPITVTCTPQFMEIRSFPGFDWSITDQMIEKMNFKSNGYYRNRRIGNFLKELQLTEGRNTGIPMTIRALLENGSQKPVFINDYQRRSLTVRIPVHRDFIVYEIRNSFDWSVSDNKAKYRTKNELQSDILKELKYGEFSARELSRRLGYSGVSTSFNNALSSLIQDGVITQSGNGRATVYGLVDRNSKEQ